MAARAVGFVSVEEYLRGDYEPDCDYVDGVLEERHRGERDHGEMEGAICTYFKGNGRKPNVRPYLEQRVQVKPTHYRVGDFLNFGVKRVWLVDSASRRAWEWDRAGMREVPDGRFHDADLDITLPLPKIFASIDAD